MRIPAQLTAVEGPSPLPAVNWQFLGFSAEFVIPFKAPWSQFIISLIIKNRKKEKENKFLSRLGVTKLEYMVTAKILICDFLDDLISIVGYILLYAALLWEAHSHALGWVSCSSCMSQSEWDSH